MTWPIVSGVLAVLRTPAAREVLRVAVSAPLAAALVALGAPAECAGVALRLFGL